MSESTSTYFGLLAGPLDRYQGEVNRLSRQVLPVEETVGGGGAGGLEQVELSGVDDKVVAATKHKEIKEGTPTLTGQKIARKNRFGVVALVDALVCFYLYRKLKPSHVKRSLLLVSGTSTLWTGGFFFHRRLSYLDLEDQKVRQEVKKKAGQCRDFPTFVKWLNGRVMVYQSKKSAGCDESPTRIERARSELKARFSRVVNVAEWEETRPLTPHAIATYMLFPESAVGRYSTQRQEAGPDQVTEFDRTAHYLLRELGWAIVDCDALYQKELAATNTALWTAIKTKSFAGLKSAYQKRGADRVKLFDSYRFMQDSFQQEFRNLQTVGLWPASGLAFQMVDVVEYPHPSDR